jgi:uncharacterized protein (DUF924 family)
MSLNKQYFSPHLYSHIQSLWFVDVPPEATSPPEAAIKKWFGIGGAEMKASFDKDCYSCCHAALDSISPTNLSLPPDATPAEPSLLSSLFDAEISTTTQSAEAAASNALSLILLLDQMSRNIYRSSQSLIYGHYDVLAQALIHKIISQQPRLDLLPQYQFQPVFRMWFYMPLMHSESPADHESFESIISQFSDDMKKRGDEGAVAFLQNNLDFEKRHLDIIKQFGRYPYRNKVMGRESTEAEKKWLEVGETFGSS